MEDKLLIELSQNKDLANDQFFCNKLAASLHTFYIKNDTFESALIKIIGKSHLDESLTLFPKQIEALQFINKNRYAVISAPTSFGKSFLVFEHISRNLDKYKNIVYVVHTKALCDEITLKAKKYFSTKYKIDNDIKSFDPNSKNFLIIISDGVNLFNFNYCIDYLVVDEAYNLDKNHSETRFLTIYRSYKILLKCSLKITLLGPFISSIIGPDAQKYKLYRTNYSPVATIINEDDDIFNISPSMRFVDFILNKRNVIGFINSKIDIYKEINSIIESKRITGSIKDPFIDWMTDYFPPFWLLPKIMKKGISVYHSSFPKYINCFSLRMFNSKKFYGLLTTSSILEGINTAAENIIIYDTDGEKGKLTPFKFYNLCGRAGRLRENIVGYIYNYGEKYAELYDQRCLPLYIGSEPETAEEKFDLGISDEETEPLRINIFEKLNEIGITDSEWYEENKFYFGSVEKLNKFLNAYESFKKLLFKNIEDGFLVNSDNKTLNKIKLFDFVYEYYVKPCGCAAHGHINFSPLIAMKVIISSDFNGLNFNLKEVCNNFYIKSYLNRIKKVELKNDYLVKLMSLAFNYIPYNFYYCIKVLYEFIAHDSYFDSETKKKINDSFFDRINRYMLNSSGDEVTRILYNKGVIPPLIEKIKNEITTQRLDLSDCDRSQIIKVCREVIRSLELTDYEKINLEDIKFNE